MEHSILEWRFLQFLIRIASLLSKRPITLLSVIVCKCWEWFSEKKYLCQIDWQERKWYSSIAVISIPFILARVLTFHLFIRSSWFVNYLFTSLTCLEGDSFFFFFKWDLGLQSDYRAGTKTAALRSPAQPPLSQPSWLRLRFTDQRTASSTGLWGVVCK